jgi:hypothetical protein
MQKVCKHVSVPGSPPPCLARWEYVAPRALWSRTNRAEISRLESTNENSQTTGAPTAHPPWRQMQSKAAHILQLWCVGRAAKERGGPFARSHVGFCIEDRRASEHCPRAEVAVIAALDRELQLDAQRHEQVRRPRP